MLQSLLTSIRSQPPRDVLTLTIAARSASRRIKRSLRLVCSNLWLIKRSFRNLTNIVKGRQKSIQFNTIPNIRDAFWSSYTHFLSIGQNFQGAGLVHLSIQQTFVGASCVAP